MKSDGDVGPFPPTPNPNENSSAIRLCLATFSLFQDKAVLFIESAFNIPKTTTSAVMSEYTSTREGFQRAMEWSLTGPPDEAKLFVEALSTPGFYQILNGQLLSYDAYVKHIEETRAKVGDYNPVL